MELPTFHPIHVSWDVHFLVEVDGGLLEECRSQGTFILVCFKDGLCETIFEC